MNAVYDWVGSLSLTPEHFTLTDFQAKSFDAEQSVKDAFSVVLYMRECFDNNELLIPTSVLPTKKETSTPLIHVHGANEFLPNKIMEEDERYSPLHTNNAL